MVQDVHVERIAPEWIGTYQAALKVVVAQPIYLQHRVGYHKSLFFFFFLNIACHGRDAIFFHFLRAFRFAVSFVTVG